MQLPANSDQPGTALVRRNAVLMRHPRLAGAVWFAGCGLIAGALLSLVSINDSFLAQLMGCAFWGAAAGALPGTVLGPGILDAQTVKSVRLATIYGAGIVFLSHFMLGVFAAVAYTVFNGVHSIQTSITIGALVCIVGGLVAGLVTLPIGIFGAYMLFRVRDYSIQPKGCTIHGYGMIEEESKSRE